MDHKHSRPQKSPAVKAPPAAAAASSGASPPPRVLHLPDDYNPLGLSDLEEEEDETDEDRRVKYSPEVNASKQGRVAAIAAGIVEPTGERLKGLRAGAADVREFVRADVPNNTRFAYRRGVKAAVRMVGRSRAYVLGFDYAVQTALQFYPNAKVILSYVEGIENAKN